MISKKLLFSIQLVVNIGIVCILASSVMAASVIPRNPDLNQPIEGVNPFTLDEAVNLISTVGKFFVVIAPVLMVISLVWGAISYMTAGGDSARSEKARGIIKYSIIGGFVIFGVGVIINTVSALVSREFFCSVGVMGVCIY
jgi:hypothetical protein